MGNRCKTCSHSKRAEIEEDLLNSVTYRSIGEKYGISHTSIRRHFENGHIAEDMVEASKLKRIAYSENLLDKLLYLQHETLKIFQEAKKEALGKQLSVAVSALSRAHDMMKTQAILAGQLKEQEINILVNPVWLSLKQEIFQALAPYPDAQGAVFAAIAGGDLPDTQKKMIIGEPQYKPMSPAVKELIDREFLQGKHDTNDELLPSEVHDKKVKKSKAKGWKIKPATPASVTRVRLLCVKEHSYRGKLWSPGQIWDSEHPDGQEPGGGNWTIFNPAVHSGLEPTARR